MDGNFTNYQLPDTLRRFLRLLMGFTFIEEFSRVVLKRPPRYHQPRWKETAENPFGTLRTVVHLRILSSDFPKPSPLSFASRQYRWENERRTKVRMDLFESQPCKNYVRSEFPWFVVTIPTKRHKAIRVPHSLLPQSLAVLYGCISMPWFLNRKLVVTQTWESTHQTNVVTSSFYSGGVTYVKTKNLLNAIRYQWNMDDWPFKKKGETSGILE